MNELLDLYVIITRLEHSLTLMVPQKTSENRNHRKKMQKILEKCKNSYKNAEFRGRPQKTAENRRRPQITEKKIEKRRTIFIKASYFLNIFLDACRRISAIIWKTFQNSHLFSIKNGLNTDCDFTRKSP